MLPLPTPLFKNAWFTNNAYGYPNAGDERRVEPIFLAALHHTANPSKPPATAQQERDNVNKQADPQRSAHLYIERRDGLPSIWAVKPTTYAAWSNGVVRAPLVDTPGIKELVAFKAKGYNANEAYDVEIEICANAANGYPITDVQVDTVAFVLAQRSLKSGVPIERRTVHLHHQIDSTGKPFCPVPIAEGEAFALRVVDLANRYRDILECMACKAANDQLTAQVGTLHGQVARLEDTVETQAATIAEQKNQIASRDTVIADHATLLLQWSAYADDVESHSSALSALQRPAAN